MASASLELFLGSEPSAALVSLASATADRFPADPTQDFLEDAPETLHGHWWVPGADGSATLIARGAFEICLADFGPATECFSSSSGPAGGDDPWAYACASNFTTARLVGEATCAVAPGEVSLHSSAGTEDGLVIVPWNP